jgi:hypothetical protein
MMDILELESSRHAHRDAPECSRGERFISKTARTKGIIVFSLRIPKAGRTGKICGESEKGGVYASAFI